MADFRAIFRSCPSCGKRFEIRLVGKKLVKDQIVRREAHIITGLPSYGVYGAYSVTTVSEDRPVVLDEKDFQYAYECKHCGHKWAEIVEETSRAKPSQSKEG